MWGVSQRIVTKEVGLDRLQCRERLGMSHHCCALRPWRVDGETRARLEGCRVYSRRVRSFFSEESRILRPRVC